MVERRPCMWTVEGSALKGGGFGFESRWVQFYIHLITNEMIRKEEPLRLLGRDMQFSLLV